MQAHVTSLGVGNVWVQGEEHPDYSKACVRAHNGAIISLQRSPFFEDVLLSVGDWSCALWKEGQHQSPLFTSPHAPAPYTAGCWSPTRPGPPSATSCGHCQAEICAQPMPLSVISLLNLCLYYNICLVTCCLLFTFPHIGFILSQACCLRCPCCLSDPLTVIGALSANQ